MYLVFTRMPGESYPRRLRSLLLYLCYVFRALIKFFVVDSAFCTASPKTKKREKKAFLLTFCMF